MDAIARQIGRCEMKSDSLDGAMVENREGRGEAVLPLDYSTVLHFLLTALYCIIHGRPELRRTHFEKSNILPLRAKQSQNEKNRNSDDGCAFRGSSGTLEDVPA